MPETTVRHWTYTMLHILLDSLERQAKNRYIGVELSKEQVFNRVRVLKAEGYADDVALSKAMKELNYYAPSSL